VISPLGWDQLERLLGICLCTAPPNKNHPRIYRYPGALDQSRTPQAGWHADDGSSQLLTRPGQQRGWLPPADLASVTLSLRAPQFPSQAFVISLCQLAFPFPPELPACQHMDRAVYGNYLKGACWHFTSNYFSSTAAAVVKCFVAMATQPEDQEVKYSSSFILRSLGVNLPAL